MKRLLKDASELSGVKYDINNLNDVYEAIHVVQEELDITGTTSKEAATTISGSAMAMKAAWTNLLGNMATGRDNIGRSMIYLGQSIKTFFAGNLMPAIGNIFGSIPKVIGTAIKVFGPELKATMLDMMNTITTTFPEAFPALIQSGSEVVLNFAKGIVSNMPELVSAAIPMLNSLAVGIRDAIPTLATTAVGLVGQFLTYLIQNGPQLLQAGLEFVAEVAGGIFNAIPVAVFAIVDMCEQLGKTILETEWGAKGMEIMRGIAIGIGTLVGEAVGKFETLKANATKKIETMKTNLSTKVEAMKTAFTTKVEAIKTGVTTKFETMKTSVSTKVENLKTTVTTKFDNIKTEISNKIDNAKTAATTKFEVIRSTIISKAESARSTVTTKFENIRSAIATKASGALSNVTSSFNTIKTRISDAVSSALTTVTSKFESIKTKARNLFSGIVPKLHLSLPSVSVSGGTPPYGIMGKGSLPQFHVTWNRKAMSTPYMLDGAQIFGFTNNNLLGGGEAGREIIYGHDALLNDIREVSGGGEVAEAILAYLTGGGLLEDLAEAMAQLGFKIDDREFGRLVRKHA